MQTVSGGMKICSDDAYLQERAWDELCLTLFFFRQFRQNNIELRFVYDII